MTLLGEAAKGAPIWSGQMKMRAIGGRLQAKGVLRGQLRLSQLGRLGITAPTKRETWRPQGPPYICFED
jgi:hypothetical protein